jgi:hypothetical protein
MGPRWVTRGQTKYAHMVSLESFPVSALDKDPFGCGLHEGLEDERLKRTLCTEIWMQVEIKTLKHVHTNCAVLILATQQGLAAALRCLRCGRVLLTHIGSLQYGKLQTSVRVQATRYANYERFMVKYG